MSHNLGTFKKRVTVDLFLIRKIPEFRISERIRKKMFAGFMKFVAKRVDLKELHFWASVSDISR